METSNNRLVLLVVGVLAALALAIPATAAAAPPAITLENLTPTQALLGTKQTVKLVATDPETQPRGYNLTFRVVLPAGVAYAGGAAPSTVVNNKPLTGQTTLIFENVSDLSPKSSYTLSFEVEPKAEAFKTVGTEYPIAAESFISEKPRRKPVFEKTGAKEGQWAETPVELEKIGRVKANSVTKLTAIEILKSEPSPEGEILRGVHEHQTVYTLTVKNNDLKPTKEVSVEDFLPAGLEYLACDEADNTTKSSTSGTAEEYAGSGPINAPGNLPPANERESCLKPTEVETVEVDPPGPQPFGVYTHVVWKGIGELAPGGERKIQYIAAIPIRSNTKNFEGPTPTPTSLGQAANLNNNNGAETYDEENLTNVAQAKGTFVGGPKEAEQTAVSDTDEITRTAEDLAVQKSVDKPTIADGQISTWTLKIESSEYRYVDNVRVDDTLPNGLCPLGPVNYEKTPPTALAECDQVKGTEPSAKYTNVEEQANGSFKIHWDQTTDAQLAELPPSTMVEIKFPTRTRVFYQENFETQTSRPILTKDSWKNEVDIAGADFARCAPNDPTCTEGQPKIFHEEQDGVDDIDHSEASQEAGEIQIQKTVRKNLEEVPGECKDESGHYVKGLLSAEPALPKYRPGDEICWRLRVEFSSNVYAGTPTVSDFIPTDEEYVQGSVVAGPSNNVASTFKEEEEVLQWTLGEGSVETSKLFEARFRTKVGTTTTSNPGEISGNLMKVAYSNSNGVSFPLRDRAEVERIEPKLKLDKRVAAVSGGTASINGEGNATGARGGQQAKYSISIKNEGNLEAKAIETWDTLPAGLKCETVVPGSISDGGTCAAGTSTIKWTGLALAVGETHVLTYEMTLPSNVAPSQTYTNTAGVTQYQSETNKGPTEPFHYYPSSNIAGTTFEGEHPPNDGSIKDTAFVSTAAVAIEKTRTTTAPVQPGNNEASQATIGEGIKYTVTTTVPAGSELFGSPTVTDPLGPRQALVPGTVKGFVNGVATPTAGVEATEEGGNPVVKFPATYSNAPGSGDDVVKLEFEVKVTDVAANARLVEEGKLTNKATLTYKDQNNAVVTKPASVTTTLVEPVISVAKTNAGSGIVEPGQIVEYTVTPSNAPESAGRVSTANDTIVADVIPAGMTPVNGTTPVSNGGTVEPSGGTWNEGTRTITWTVATLAPGASKPLSYLAQVNKPANAGSTFKNTVLAQTTSLGGAVAGERTAASTSHAGYEATAEDTVRLTEARLEKSVVAPQGLTIGDPLVYTLHLKLPPQIAFFDTTVEDHLPKGVVFDGTQSIKCESGCESLAQGAVKLKEGEEGGSPLLGWWFGEKPSAEVPVSEVERTITIVYNAHIGKELGTGGAPVIDGTVLTNHAIGLYNGKHSVGYPIPTEATAPPARTLFTNKTNEPPAFVTVKEPKLTIRKSVAGNTSPGKTQPGDALTYTIEVENTGDSSAYDTVVEDDNPNPLGGLGTVDTTGGSGVGFLKPEAGKGLRWVIPGPIEPGAAHVVTLTYRAALKPSPQLTNGETVPNTANIPAYFGAPKAQRELEGLGRFHEYVEDPSSSVSLVVELPKLQVTKTAGPEEEPEAEARIGQSFKWQIEVKNVAAFAGLQAVDVFDELPQGWEYLAGSSAIVGVGPIGDPQPGAGGQVEWHVNRALVHGESFKIAFEAVPSSTLIGQPGPYVNKAIAKGKDLGGYTAGGGSGYEAEGTATANLKVPGLTLEKTPDNGPAIAGEPSLYEIKITNNGEAAAEEVEVTDTLPNGLTYTGGSATANPTTGFSETSFSGNTVVWKIATIPGHASNEPAASVTITVPVAIPANTAENTLLVNSASAVSREQKTPAVDTGSLNVTREADLSIKKTASVSEAIPGEGIEYTLSYKNEGPSDAENVVVKDQFPTSLKYLTADSPCKLSTTGTEVECELGPVAAGAESSRDIDFEVLPSVTTSIVNEATIESLTPDPEHGNDQAELTTPVKPEAELELTKTGPTQPVLLGGNFGYEIKLENKGPSDAANVVVTDELPPQVKFVSADAPCEENGSEPEVVTCPVGALLHGETKVFHLTVTAIGIPTGGEPIGNTAKVTTSTAPRPGSVKESTAETEVLPAADLSIAKTAPATVEANGELTYKLHVENHGPSVAHGVTVTDPLPAGVDFVAASEGCANAAGTVTCTVQPAGELAVGATADFTVTVHVPYTLGAQPLVNTASVKGEEADPKTENDQSTVTTTVGPAADLAITKTMGKAEAGKPLIYTLAVTDKGPSASSAVTVKDTLPAGTTFKSAAPSQGSCSASGQEVTCQLGGLAAGGSAQVSITVEVGATVTGTLKNTAKVEGPEPDPEKANNESSVEGPVTPAAPSAPNLKVVKTASTSAPQVGTPFSYTVAVSNMGGAEAKNVKVVDTLSGPVKVLSIETESGKCGAAGSKIECTIPSIAVGKTVRITYSVVAEEAGQLSNTASAQASNGETAPANNHAVKSVKAKAGKASKGGKANFTLTKTAAKKVVEGGRKVAFTITLHNGSTALVNAKICDRLPAALVFVKAAGASFVKGEACWQKKYVAAHKTLKLHLTARAVRGFKPRKARNVASASAENAPNAKHASATVRIKPAFAGAPGGVTG